MILVTPPNLQTHRPMHFEPLCIWIFGPWNFWQCYKSLPNRQAPKSLTSFGRIKEILWSSQLHQQSASAPELYTLCCYLLHWPSFRSLKLYTELYTACFWLLHFSPVFDHRAPIPQIIEETIYFVLLKYNTIWYALIWIFIKPLKIFLICCST